MNHQHLHPSNEKQVLINEKKYEYSPIMGSEIAFIQWSNGSKHLLFFFPVFFYFSLLKAYALSEMSNIERLRNVEQQITSTVDEVSNNFKQRIQSILSENQLLLSIIIKSYKHRNDFSFI